jgi:hypothetical protein
MLAEKKIKKWKSKVMIERMVNGEIKLWAIGCYSESFRNVSSNLTRGAKTSIVVFRGFLVSMEYYLYILKSKVANKYYTGISQNPTIRLSYHNNIEKGFTKNS